MNPFLGEYLFGRARFEILRALLEGSARSWSVLELRMRSGTSDVAVRRELNALSGLGLLTSTRPARGPRQYKVVDGHPGIRALDELVFARH
jgi:hypothetical protein